MIFFFLCHVSLWVVLLQHISWTSVHELIEPTTRIMIGCGSNYSYSNHMHSKINTTDAKSLCRYALTTSTHAQKLAGTKHFIHPNKPKSTLQQISLLNVLMFRQNRALRFMILQLGTIHLILIIILPQLQMVYKLYFQGLFILALQLRIGYCCWWNYGQNCGYCQDTFGHIVICVS